MSRAAAWIALVLAIPASSPAGGEPPEAPARRPLVLAHVMPWFAAKPASPVWGWHWTMGRVDPDQVRDGRRAIAAHDSPLIGPYDSGDPAVVEYQTLLMKLAGIDGVIVDWYGRADLFDHAQIHRNSERLVAAAGRAGLLVAPCYEDQTVAQLVREGKITAAGRVAHARGEVDWLRAHWLAAPSALRHEGRPVLLSFGADGLTDDEWSRVLPAGADALIYLSEHHRRPPAAGAFDWPIPQEGVEATDRFRAESRTWPVSLPVAFPRFRDYYAEAKVRPSYGSIPDDDGRTFTTTLDRAFASGAPFVQVATWNDWGEGTAIEPSVGVGDRDLRALQARRARLDPAFKATAADLGLPGRLLAHRRAPSRDPGRAAALDAIAAALASGRIAAARAGLDRIEAAGPAVSPGNP